MVGCSHHQIHLLFKHFELNPSADDRFLQRFNRLVAGGRKGRYLVRQKAVLQLPSSTRIVRMMRASACSTSAVVAAATMM